jgi:type IV pilus assembly protein PilQ
MRMYSRRTLCHAMALIALLGGTGCVKRMSAVTPAQTEASAFARLRAVTVSPDASRVEIVSDQPLTYTSYKAGEPAKIVVDISQTEPGPVATPIEVNRGNIRRIDLVRQPVGGGVLTRVEVSLARDVDFSAATDPTDKTRLVVSLLPGEGEAKPAFVEVKAAPVHAEAKEAPLAEGRIEEKNLAPEIPPPPVAKPEPPPQPVSHAAVAASPAPAPVEEPRGQRKVSEAGVTRRLNGISKVSDGVELSIEGGVETFNSFRLKKPERIVLDMFGMKSALPKNVVPIGAFGVADARVGTTPDKLRIVLDSSDTTLPPFDVVKTGQGLKIRFKAGTAVSTAAAPAPVAAPPARAVRALPPEPAVPAPAQVKAEVAPAHLGQGSLESLDFKVVDGFSRITLKLYGTCEPGQPVHGVQGISLSIRNCQVPKQLQRALNTSQFGSPVVSVTPYQVKVKGVPVAKLLVRLKGSPAYTMNRKGNVLVLDVANPGPLPAPQLPAAAAPRVKRAAEPKMAEELAVAPPTEEVVTEIPSSRPAKKVYHGRKVTLEFSDADIRKIFQLIAEVSNLNFLISDDVQGTITIKLVNVPWDQALDAILDAKGLGMQREGNIVQIKPRAKIASQADEELAAKRAAELGMPLVTAVFDVNYASVSDVVTQFSQLKSTRTGTGIIKDDRTNRVIVTDIQSSVDAMRQLLKTLDAPEKQVMIEARIVEATSTFTRDLGVQWGLHYKDGSASFAGINTVDTGFGGVVSPAGPGSTGAGGIGLGMAFGKLTSNIQLDMRLSAAATIGQVKIISTPKVVTLNNKAAKISQGQSIPYQTTSAEGTKTEFVEAALTLEVTPHITADGAVSMKIKASNNSPGTGSPPPINKKEATTELVVANGETTVIGGIYVDSDTESDTGIPFLSDIPLLGWMFKSNAKQKTKTELLIFITPKVVI